MSSDFEVVNGHAEEEQVGWVWCAVGCIGVCLALGGNVAVGSASYLFWH